MAIPIIPSLLRDNLAALAADDQRLDGRKRFEGRDLEIEIDCLYNAEGSCRVRMGDTIVLAGVKFQIMTPYPDRPTQGGLMTSAEIRPVCGPNWEPGPPSEESIEMGRVVDRGIRESGCIDTNELCILPGEKAWQPILLNDSKITSAFIFAVSKVIPGSKISFLKKRSPPSITKCSSFIWSIIVAFRARPPKGFFFQPHGSISPFTLVVASTVKLTS